jgi:Transposase DDE domain
MIQKVEHKVLKNIETQSQAYRAMFKDKRLFTTFQGIVKGILVSGSSRISQIARSSPFADKAHSEKRIRRFVHGEHQRAEVTAETLVSKLLEEGSKRLRNAKRVTVIMDGSDLRKRYSQKLEHLSHVRSLEGTLIAGYPTLNAIGLAEDGTKALLYHETYSSEAPGFKSQNELVKAALQRIVTELRSQGVGQICFVLDRGFDDAKLMRFIDQDLKCQYVIRAQHIDRRIRDQQGKTQALKDMLDTHEVTTTLDMNRPTVHEDGKVRYRKCKTELRASAFESVDYSFRSNAIGLTFKGKDKPSEKDDGWILLTNLPIDDPEFLKHIIALYLGRWSIEDVFAWTKQALGWEQVRVLEFSAFRTLVALAFVAASFVFDLGADPTQPDIKLLARLGGYVPHKNRPPGKKCLLLGLQRLVQAQITAALLDLEPNSE